MPLNQSTYSKTVFVDTNVIIALEDEDDSKHEEALKIFHFLVEKEYYLFISNYIVAEVHAFTLNRNRLKDISQRVQVAFNPNSSKLNDILQRTQVAFETLKWLYEDFAVLFVDQNLEKKAREELLKYNDKLWSIADMTSFLLIQEYKIAHFFSFDSDFSQASYCFGFSDIKFCLAS